jgi:hypothetical protein
MVDIDEGIPARPRTTTSDNLWFLHNPPNPTRTHASLKDLHGLWPHEDLALVAGKRRATLRQRPDTQVSLEGATVTIPGEQAIIAEDNAIIVTAQRLRDPQKLFKKVVEYEKVRTSFPRLKTRILISALPAIAGITYVVLSKPDQSPTILIGGLTSITGAIGYNSYYLGKHLQRSELTNYLEKELAAPTHTQGRALDHTIMTVRQGYDEIVRQLTIKALIGEGCAADRAQMLAALAIEKGARQATTLAPEHHQALQQSRPDLARQFIAQLFPGADPPILEKLITLR